jgi:hypothetical protein
MRARACVCVCMWDHFGNLLLLTRPASSVQEAKLFFAQFRLTDCLKETVFFVSHTPGYHLRDWCLGGTEWCLGGTDWCFGGTDWCLGGTDWCLRGMKWCPGGTEWCLGGTEWFLGVRTDVLGVRTDVLGVRTHCQCVAWRLAGWELHGGNVSLINSTIIQPAF